MTNTWESCFWGWTQFSLNTLGISLLASSSPRLASSPGPKSASFYITRAQRVCVDVACEHKSHGSKRSAVYAPCYGRTRVEAMHVWQKILSCVIPNREVLWGSGDEIRIVSNTELSRNWMQVFKEAWLSQPYHIQRHWRFCALRSKFLLHPL